MTINIFWPVMAVVVGGALLFGFNLGRRLGRREAVALYERTEVIRVVVGGKVLICVTIRTLRDSNLLTGRPPDLTIELNQPSGGIHD